VERDGLHHGKQDEDGRYDEHLVRSRRLEPIFAQEYAGSTHRSLTTCKKTSSRETFERSIRTIAPAVSPDAPSMNCKSLGMSAPAFRTSRVTTPPLTHAALTHSSCSARPANSERRASSP